MKKHTQLMLEVDNLIDRLKYKANYPGYDAVDREFYRAAMQTIIELRQGSKEERESAYAQGRESGYSEHQSHMRGQDMGQ